jgi:hypothetical protein
MRCQSNRTWETAYGNLACRRSNCKVESRRSKEERRVSRLVAKSIRQHLDCMVKVTRGKRHNYLGMTLDYSTPGEVKIDMVEYNKSMIKTFPEEIRNKIVTTPSSESLFETPEHQQKYFFVREFGQASVLRGCVFRINFHNTHTSTQCVHRIFELLFLLSQTTSSRNQTLIATRTLHCSHSLLPPDAPFPDFWQKFDESKSS